MDFSAANTALWNPVVQLGIIACLVLVANLLRQKIPFIRTSLMPTAVLAGFILLILRTTNILPIVDIEFLEIVTYHAIALGFIALSLRVPDQKSEAGALLASKNGALIVSTYLVQAVVGLVISIGLTFTVMPNFFRAAGILLPMAYGQGPGQANNVGTTYEALGMMGGRSFGLSLAATGFLVACIVGVLYLNVLNRQGKIRRPEEKEFVSESIAVDTFQDQDEIPISESIDRFSVQAALVCLIYLLTYLLTKGIVALLDSFAPGLADMVGTLLWGFNFIFGSLLATLCHVLFKNLRKVKLMNHRYQNNYLLSRISGVAFDFMIVAGIASINMEDLSGNWIPFLLMAVLGGIATFLYLRFMCKKLYPDYFYEGFFSMFGMLTGTISSGVLLLREVDPNLKTPASNNLITGSSFGIVFGIPMLLLISFAAKGGATVFIALGFVVLYLIALLLFIFKAKGKEKQ